MNMELDKDKLRRKLIWKYFWERKREESWAFLKQFWILIFGVIWYPSSLGMMVLSPEGSTVFMAGAFLLFGGFIFIVVGVIVMIIYLLSRKFIRWIRSNWEWAAEDADIELRRRRKR